MTDDVPTPDSVAAWLLALAFGSPSFVVSLFLFVNCLWAWWSLGRDTARVARVVWDRSLDKPYEKSLKYRATLRLAVGWCIFYGAASFITQIWAGSQYSKSQGGGLKELLQWSAIFGVAAILGCLLLTPTRGPQFTDPGWTPFGGMGVGYVIGLVWAVIAFTAKAGGPRPGDWWVCPAMSCIGVWGSSMHKRISAYEYWRKRPPLRS